MISASMNNLTNTRFSLQKALFIYEGAQQHLVTVQDAVSVEGQPRLGPARLLTMDVLVALYQNLYGAKTIAYLPANVLAHDLFDLVWWIPASQRPLFFAKTTELYDLSGRLFPCPPMVLHANNRTLSVYALRQEERPGLDTELWHAPYWNTYQDGSVCLGSAKVPSQHNIQAMDGWVEAYFRSAFAHTVPGWEATAHPKGFPGLCREIVGKPVFAYDYLKPSQKQLRSILS